jgi:L-ascorbate metabolism protein UlaG (beta-lactamase superfamily)
MVLCYHKYYKLKTYVEALPVDENFNGERFVNIKGDGLIKEDSNLRTFLKWRFSGEKRGQWPKWVDFPQQKLELRKDDEIVITFINHSTILLQTPYGNIITDPVFSERVGPFNIIGPKRIHKAGIDIGNLPKIDYILVSHDHYDHMDLSSLKFLQKKYHSKIFGGLGLSVYDKDLHIKEMDWWHTEIINKNLKIHFVPAKHWSGRYGFFGNNKTLWGGFLIEIKGKIIYFAGDTGFTKHFFEIARRYTGKIVLSFLPIGAYEPGWFMQPSHTSPEEAVKAHLLLGSKRTVPIHYGTFCLSNESYEQPLIDLKNAMNKFSLKSEAIVQLNPGQSLTVTSKEFFADQ